MNDRIEQLARDLAAAWKGGTTVPLPAAGPAGRAEAYRIQDRMAELIGGKVAGWKVGATVPAVQRFEGHDGPLPGRIFADRCFDSPATVPARLLPGVKVECEFAFRLTRPLPADLDLTGCLSFHPAVELAASRWAPGTGNRALTTFDGIADNGTGGAAVLGAAVERWQDLPFETLAIEARIDDSPPIQAYSGAYRRDPVAIAAETFADLRGRGIEPEPGWCLLTGSLTLPTPIRAGQVLTVRFGDLPELRLTMA